MTYIFGRSETEILEALALMDSLKNFRLLLMPTQEQTKMTREEAYASLRNKFPGRYSTEMLKDQITMLEALGLIKFDEPTYQQFAEVDDINGNVQKVKLRDMISMLIASGYKVEKIK